MARGQTHVTNDLDDNQPYLPTLGISTSTAARIANISTKTVLEAIRAGELPVVTLGSGKGKNLSLWSRPLGLAQAARATVQSCVKQGPARRGRAASLRQWREIER
jgi:hypothetical protein